MKARASVLPDGALLARYGETGGTGRDSNYVDCFRARIDRPVDIEAYVAAFYRTPLFRLERLILGSLMKLPSTDEEALAVAAGHVREFAAWSVEARTADQCLMCAVDKRTRSWFMVRPCAEGTVLLFGSAVLTSSADATGTTRGNVLYRILLPLHRVYSVLLLGAAQRKLARDGSKQRMR